MSCVASYSGTDTPTAAPNDASTDVSASPSSSPPAAPSVSKSLLLRVKRKRHESPMETLLVTSERSEKKAALQDLRQQFQSTNIGSTTAATAAAADAASPAATTAAASSLTSPSSSGFSTKPVSAARMRVFRLLTSTSAPKDTHTSDPAIAARIAQLRQRAIRTGTGPSLPALVPTAEDVKTSHRVSQQLSQQEKRELRLQDNREKLLRLQQQSLLREPTQQLVHVSDELQLKIVDIQLPKPFKETFAPPPDQSKQNQRRREKEAREVMSNSHRSASSISKVDPVEAAKQFTTAMTAIKAMPSVGRTQMDTYKALLEDYLSTLPDQPKPAASAQTPAAASANNTTASPAALNATASSSAEQNSSNPAQEPFVNQVAPKIPLRRRKKLSAAPAALAADEPISFMSTADQPPPKQILAEVRTAGGQAYEPDMLVPASGFSMHAAKKPQSGPSATEEDDDEYVYDVYQMEDTDATSSSTNASASTLTDEDYKAHYTGPGVSTAYVVVDGAVLRWIGGGEEFVNEAELSDDDEAHIDDDDDENEIDYPEEEDSSAGEDETREYGDEEFHASEYHSRHYHDSPHSAVTAEWDALSSRSNQLASLRHLKKTQPASHGFYDNEDGPEAEDDEEVREVRKAMKGGRAELSSDEDEDRVHYHPHRAQEDEDYLDSIEAEEDMDHMRDEDGNEDDY